jgi:hypothetical protein
MSNRNNTRMNIKTTPDQHLEMMRTIESVLRYFMNENNITMYQDVVGIREYLQYIADDRTILLDTIDRMAVNSLSNYDKR